MTASARIPHRIERMPAYVGDLVVLVRERSAVAATDLVLVGIVTSVKIDGTVLAVDIGTGPQHPRRDLAATDILIVPQRQIDVAGALAEVRILVENDQAWPQSVDVARQLLQLFRRDQPVVLQVPDLSAWLAERETRSCQ